MIDRRMFLAGVAYVLAPLVATAQPQRRTWHIGYLGGNDYGNTILEHFRDGMRKLGYVEGRDYVLEVRWGRGSRSARSRWRPNSPV